MKTPDAMTPSSAKPDPSGRRVVAIVVGIQLAISLGYFAVMAHVVSHLRHDLGMLAGTITVVLAVRVAVQNMLYLPAGALTDAIGPARTGALACVLRAAAFALLGTTEGVGELLLAVVVMAVGGALFHPAAQSGLAGVAPSRRSRGFSAYVIAGQLGAVAGPPFGLALLAGGFGLLSAVTAGTWVAGAVLFVLLHHPSGAVRRAHGRAGVRPGARGLAEGVSAVFRDRAFLLFALAAAPSTLLTTQVATVVPLKEVGSGTTTLFFCVVAVATAAVQPWCGGGRGERLSLLRTGLLCAGAGYLVLLAVPSDRYGRIAVLMTAAALHGSAAGLTQSALFQAVARCAPPQRFGVYLGLLSFLAGAVSLAGGFTLGPLLNAGTPGTTTAMTGLGLVAALSAAALRIVRTCLAPDRTTGRAAEAPCPPWRLEEHPRPHRVGARSATGTPSPTEITGHAPPATLACVHTSTASTPPSQTGTNDASGCSGAPAAVSTQAR